MEVQKYMIPTFFSHHGPSIGGDIEATPLRPSPMGLVKLIGFDKWRRAGLAGSPRLQLRTVRACNNAR
ncbi:unnamed protein product, partial [Nesidiocoris tenuis]